MINVYSQQLEYQGKSITTCRREGGIRTHSDIIAKLLESENKLQPFCSDGGSF